MFFRRLHFPLIAPGAGGAIVKLICDVLKVSVFILFYLLIRWTIRDFRFDQLMGGLESFDSVGIWPILVCVMG